MKGVNFTEVPTTAAESLNGAKETWKDGRLVALDEGRHVTLYLGHRTYTRTEAAPDGVVAERTATEAFAVRVAKPLTKAAAVNAAEMAAYGLRSAMDVASLNAGLARKWRENINDVDVREHDELMAWVKAELAATGMFKDAVAVTDTGKATLADMSRLVRMQADGLGLTAAEALAVRSIYPDWEAGEDISVGDRRNYGGELWEAVQAHTTQEDWEPGEATLALWKKVDAEGHAGTEDDPIPYEQGMALEKGKYYEQGGVTYECIQAMPTGMPYDLKDIPAVARPVG